MVWLEPGKDGLAMQHHIDPARILARKPLRQKPSHMLCTGWSSIKARVDSGTPVRDLKQ